MRRAIGFLAFFVLLGTAIFVGWNSGPSNNSATRLAPGANELECASGDLVRETTADFPDGARGFKGTANTAVREVMTGLQPSDQQIRIDDDVVLMRDGEIVGLASPTLNEDNRWVVESSKVCASSGIGHDISRVPWAMVIEDCRSLRIPRDVELDTNLDRENKLLTISYSDGTRNRSPTIRYKNHFCQGNPSTRRVILHVLTANNPHVRNTFVVACLDPAQRPQEMVLACADAGFQAQDLTWARWTRHGAQGRGLFEMKKFPPPSYDWASRTGQISLRERRFCIDIERYVFMRGRVIFDELLRGRRSYDLNLGVRLGITTPPVPSARNLPGRDFGLDPQSNRAGSRRPCNSRTTTGSSPTTHAS